MLGYVGFALAALAGQSLAIPTIVAKGAKFFDSTGQQFYIKGIAYQLTNSDPLISTEQCQLDAALMKSLGANSIRVYHVDPSGDHDGCMAAFANAGIYAWIDLDTFSTYILQEQSLDPSWTQDQFNAYAKVMDAFQGYDNVAGFFVGNEVLTSGPQSIAAPYVKAAGRDMKAYGKSKGYRPIPIGYSAADIPALRPNLQNYLACGTDSADALDFYGLNAYEWCGSATYQTSGYDMLQKNASMYNIPIFFSETGCRVPQPRLFQDQSAIFGSEMENTWSGAIVYEWIEEQNDYGLISYGPPAATGAAGPNVVDGFTRAGTPTPIQPGFDNLSNEWKTLSPTGVSMADYSPSLTPPPCPAYTSGFWDISGDVPLPTIGQSAISAAAAAAVTPNIGSGGNSTSSGVDSSGASSSEDNASQSSGSQSSGSQTSGSQTNSSSGSASHSSSAANSLQMKHQAGDKMLVFGASLMAFVLGIALAL